MLPYNLQVFQVKLAVLTQFILMHSKMLLLWQFSKHFIFAFMKMNKSDLDSLFLLDVLVFEMAMRS